MTRTARTARMPRARYWYEPDPGLVQPVVGANRRMASAEQAVAARMVLAEAPRTPFLQWSATREHAYGFRTYDVVRGLDLSPLEQAHADDLGVGHVMSVDVDPQLWELFLMITLYEPGETALPVPRQQGNARRRAAVVRTIWRLTQAAAAEVLAALFAADKLAGPDADRLAAAEAMVGVVR